MKHTPLTHAMNTNSALLRALCLLCAFSILLCAFAPAPDVSALVEWRAGEIVSEESVAAHGLDNCFAFEPIPDEVWTRMQGKTYKENPHIGREDLRRVRVLHRDGEQNIRLGEMVCNRIIAERLVDIFRRLYDARYPIARMVLPDVYDADDEAQMRDNNSSCFCYRPIVGTTKLSKHGRGLAVDINTLYNPFCKRRDDGGCFVQPATGATYCDRKKDFPYKIDREDLAFKLFTERGFTWGGDWTTHKDYQHFELKEESE